MLSPRSGVEPLDPIDIFPYLSGSEQRIYVEIAVATILCYDAIIMFDKEVKYFWSSPRRTVSRVYFLNRYMGVVCIFSYIISWLYHTDSNLCYFSMWFGDAGHWVIITLIDYILLMRVIALWSEERKLAVCLKAFFAIGSTLMLGIWIGTILMEKVNVAGTEGFTFCDFDHIISPLLYALYWSIPFLFELVLIVLALYKAVDFWRESAGFDGANLAKVVIQDQAIYFFLVMASSAANIIIIWTEGTGSPDAAAYVIRVMLMTATVPCIVGCRLLVHLHEAAERGYSGGTSCRALSEIQFV